MKKVNPNRIPGSWEEADRQRSKGHWDGFQDAVNIVIFALMDNYGRYEKDVYTLIYDIEHDLHNEVYQGRFYVPDYERYLEKNYQLRLKTFPDGIEIPQNRPCTKGDEKHAYRSGYREGLRLARALVLKSFIYHDVSADDLREAYSKIRYKYESVELGYFTLEDVKNVIDDEYGLIFCMHEKDPPERCKREYYTEWEAERNEHKA